MIYATALAIAWPKASRCIAWPRSWGAISLDTTRIYTQGHPGDLQREVEKIAWK